MRRNALYLLPLLPLLPATAGLPPAAATVPAETDPDYARPSINAFYPQSGVSGTTVIIQGRGLSSPSRVTFGGVPATFYPNNRSWYLIAKVPANAVTGPIAVTTSQGTATSARPFTVTGTQTLTIASFSPAQGAEGTVVTLTGTGFTSGAGVAFNGKAATAVTFVSATQLKATVPPGATTGTITVTTTAGTATSSGVFTVTQATAPTLASFTPAQGAEGTVVTLTGTGFTSSAAVAFNGKAATSITLVSATQLQATVPAGATTGTLTVTTAAGTATSSGVFTVTQAAAPTIASFTPTQGAAGAVVTLTGTGFTSSATVAFNGRAATAVTFVSATQLQATVPAGATTGPLKVTTAAGTATSSGTFTVQATPTSTLDLTIGGWYLNQSVQTLQRSVPLVAGKNGFLRVFALANQANSAAPKVRVTITGGSPSPWVQTIPAPGASVPTAIAEGTLSSSWNLAVPGAVLTASSSILLELDPEGAIPEANDGNNALTSSLTAQKLGAFKTTLIPVTQAGLTGNVASSGRTLASWVKPLNALYPIANGQGDMDVTQGAAYTTQANLNSGSGGWSTLLGELNSKRVAEGTGRYYYGVVSVNYSSGLAGLGYIGMPTAIGWDKGGYDFVFAHETGHNFNRSHAPCGGPSGVDTNWPTGTAYASAQIGVYGYDTSDGTAKAPTAYKDLMSYCNPEWISDYTYKGVLSFRASGRLNGALAEALPSEAEEALPAPTECLLVSGQVRNGQVSLNPAYVVHTRPVLPEPGENLLELKDNRGLTLRQVPFAATPVADLEDRTESHFTFALPLTCEQEAAYRSLRVITPQGGLVSRNAGPGEVYQLPTATPFDQVTRVQWDHQAFPTALIRDPETREVLAFAQGGTVELPTQARTLEITLSDGVRSRRLLVNAR